MTDGIREADRETYHADLFDDDTPSLSAGIAHILISQSPAHAWTAHPRLNPDYRTREEDRFDIGTVAHALLIEGREVVQVVDAPDWRTKDAKEAKASIRAGGRVPLLLHQWETVSEMVEVARSRVLAVDASPPLFRDGKPEATLLWNEPDGTLCRARCDWLRDDHMAIDDYKTTSASANPERWIRTMLGIGGDIQAAFYLRGLERLTGERAEFRFVVQETFPPYELSVVTPGAEMMEYANAKVDYALKLWSECLSSGNWPGYEPRVAVADLPAWEGARWLEREARETA